MISGFDCTEKNGLIDWEKLPSASLRFAYLKASEGLFLADEAFSANRTRARQLGWLVGGYHWLNPRLNCQLQAEKFAQIIGSTAGELPPAVCLELYRAPLADMDRNVRSFVETLSRLVSRKVIIYTSGTYWKSYLPKSEWANNCLLWIDQPGSFFPGQLFPWSTWSFWQASFKSVLPGISGSIGFNRFNGSENELRQMVSV
jgi:lysozyme